MILHWAPPLLAHTPHGTQVQPYPPTLLATPPGPNVLVRTLIGPSPMRHTPTGLTPLNHTTVGITLLDHTTAGPTPLNHMGLTLTGPSFLDHTPTGHSPRDHTPTDPPLNHASMGTTPLYFTPTIPIHLDHALTDTTHLDHTPTGPSPLNHTPTDLTHPDPALLVSIPTTTFSGMLEVSSIHRPAHRQTGVPQGITMEMFGGIEGISLGVAATSPHLHAKEVEASIPPLVALHGVVLPTLARQLTGSGCCVCVSTCSSCLCLIYIYRYLYCKQ